MGSSLTRNGTHPPPPPLEVWLLNHWISREVPSPKHLDTTPLLISPLVQLPSPPYLLHAPSLFGLFSLFLFLSGSVLVAIF